MYGKSSSSSNTNTMLPGPLTSERINPIGNVFIEAGNNLVKNEFGAYGEKIFGSSSSFLQSNYVSRHLSNPQYYLEVNDDYVKNKIKMILFPFLHKVCRKMFIYQWDYSFLLLTFDNNWDVFLIHLYFQSACMMNLIVWPPCIVNIGTLDKSNWDGWRWNFVQTSILWY